MDFLSPPMNIHNGRVERQSLLKNNGPRSTIMSQQQRSQHLRNDVKAPRLMTPTQIQNYSSSTTPKSTRSRNENKEKAYKFGDLTRGVIAKGKKKDGREESSGYKFGDFTRGLFG